MKKSAINWAIEFVAAIYWTFKTARPSAKGRWHVFRDAPTWYVRRIADAPFRSEILTNWKSQACAELALRDRGQP